VETTLNPGRKNKIAALKRISGSFHINTLKPQIAAIEEVFQESEVINVALVGRFKAGKSSFLNSVIGKDAIPVGVLPLTAAVTRIRYGSNDKAEVSFLNGQVKNVSFIELPDFIAEERNPENAKKVSRVDLELSCLREYPGIQFVDTPGLGSVYQHNTATSKDWMPRAGAALLAISIDHPLSEDDIALLKELESYTSETHILLTKIDLVSPEEVPRVIMFIKTQIQKNMNKELNIFPFSTKPGFETARELVYQFIKSISHNHRQKSEEIIGYKLSSVISQCLGYLQLAVSAAAATEQSRQLLQQQLLQERKNLSSIQNEIEAIINKMTARLRTESRKKFQEQLPQLKQRLIARLAQSMPLWKGNLDKVRCTFWDWLSGSLTENLENISNELGSRISSSYANEMLSSCSRITRAFQDRVAKDIEKSLHTQFHGASFEVQIEKPKEPDVRLYYDFPMSLLTFIRVFIPVRWVLPLLKRRFMSQIHVEVEKNLSRLAFQWVDAISFFNDRMKDETLEFIGNEIAAVENLLTESLDHRAEIEKSIRELNTIAAVDP
jgi:GTP-binding protein EngB required for normal cell division